MSMTSPRSLDDGPPEARAWAALGIAAAASAGLMPELLRQGGVAPLLVAVAVAATLGAPAAHAEAAERAELAPWERVLSAWLLIGTASAALAAAATPLGWLGIVPAGILWTLVAWPKGASALGAALAAAGGAWLGVTVPALHPLVALRGTPEVTVGAPWALLQPAWSSWMAWLPGALLLGLLLPAAGLGFWRARAPARDGLPSTAHPTAAWLTAGLGCWLIAGLAWVLATDHATLPAEVARGAVSSGWLLAIGACGAASLGAREETTRSGRLALGLVLTCWFVFTGPSTIAWWWQAWLPLGITALTGARAFREGTRFGWPVGVASVALLALLLQPHPIPTQPAAAAAVAGTLVVWVWGVGLHAFRLERA
jgi:hypothetical protein